MTYSEWLRENNDKIINALNYEKEIDMELVEEQQKIIDSVRYKHEHKWDNELIKGN